MDIEKLIAEFNDYAMHTTSKLDDVLAIISEGRIPNKDMRAELDSVIQNLCEKYESVKSFAEAELSKDELPEEGSSISVYYDAINNSKAALLNAQLKEIESTLSRFISVQSLMARYTAALKPIQDEAKALLGKLESEDITDIDDISKQAEGPQLFLKALECPDLNTDEGNDMLDSLSDNYDYHPYIIRGLLSKSYFIQKSELNTEVNDNVEQMEAVEDTSISTPTVTTPVTSKIDENDSAEINEANVSLADADATSKENSEETAKETGSAKEVSPFRAALEEKNVALEDKSYGILSKEISSQETKKLSASIFSNDIRKGDVTACKLILRQVDKNTLLSPELLDTIAKMPKNVGTSALDFLQKKGYLRKYKIIPGGEFYCTSPRLEKALTFKEAAKFAGTRQFSEDDWSEQLDATVARAAARAALLKLDIQSLEAHKYRKQDFTTQQSLRDESFIIKRFEHIAPHTAELLAGVFFTNYDDVDGFADAILEYLEDVTRVSIFVLAAANKEMAKTIAAEIIKLAPEKLGEIIYLYDASVNKCYAYDSDEEEDLKDIITITLLPNDFADILGESDDIESDDDDDFEEGIVETIDEDDDSFDMDDLYEESDDEDLDESEDTASMPLENAAIHKLIIEGKDHCVTAFAYALSLEDPSWTEKYDRLAYAYNDPMKHCTYSSDTVFDLIPNENSEFSQCLMAAIGLRTFFSNQVPYDYNINGVYNAIKDYPIFSELHPLDNVLYKLEEFKAKQKKGMDAYADYHAKSVAQLNDEITQVQHEARTFYESIILGKKKEKANQRRFVITKKLLFDAHGDLGQYIKAIIDDDRDVQPLIVDFLQKNFIKEGNALAEDTLDSDMLFNFILKYWDEAGDQMITKFRADLMSHLRSNIVNTTTKGVQLLIRWCNLIEKSSNQVEDAGSIEYKRVKSSLLSYIERARKAITSSLHARNQTKEKQAGLLVIDHALSTIHRCLDGTLIENINTYFYAQFLATDDVLLDENFYPDFDVHGSDIEELQPKTRILAHALKAGGTPLSRLKEIFEESGDDIGTARLLIQYLHGPNASSSTDEEWVMMRKAAEDYALTIDTCEEYARETAELKKEEFIGELELAQSYGQIDNSNASEDKKEKILQIIDAWYEATLENSNYGFFARVMDSYLAEIKKEAKSREADLLEQLEAFKKTSVKGLHADEKDKKIKKIRAAIEQQNYTVAEDLLARADQPDAERSEIIEENFLRDFLDDYNDYYQAVATSQSSFASLVSNRARNKEEKGGKRLADNWLPGGSRLGRDRLTALLSGLGFKVDTHSVQEKETINRLESYNVKTVKARDGKRDIYTHPIAAFGSGAAEDGFRVVCLNGKYDAAGLIDIMKQLGNAKHTMILLDCALDKPERRILARRSKTELGDKLFVVIDRTVMMYMVKNYDETKANRMLMSLIVPFGYYQPYVWESSNVMPPEIFMGRKHELESIESPTGANIVYGGRQLGKSALLKKAREDIDKDENGDRAVLVEIKGLNYEAAAKKIGHALYDEGILTEDIATTDWDDLSRAIRKRLQSDTDRIPYLLLLLDEADTFIESCEAVNFHPFDALKEIQSIGTGRFKFVIAGLRNIVRFKRDAALGNNSVLTHLESITVKPFQPAEARELMELPLHYLGLEFPKKNESLMTLILATTNYFPGLIQMYCAKLLTAMRSKDYAGYDEADTPIYEISEDHIKKILADSEFTTQIREKFFITLKLDEDNYYYLIALIMAYLYHNNGYNEGYSAEAIKNAGQNLSIAKIANLDNDKLSAFMEELKELNVLRSTDDSHYLFSKFSFFQMMGTSSEVDDKLVEYMED